MRQVAGPAREAGKGLGIAVEDDHITRDEMWVCGYDPETKEV